MGTFTDKDSNAAPAGHLADIVVGVPGAASESGAQQTAAAVAAELRDLYPSLASLVVFLSGGSTFVGSGSPLENPSGVQRVQSLENTWVVDGALRGMESGLRVVLQAAVLAKASVCAVVAAGAQPTRPPPLRALLSPVLDSGHDFVCPVYVRHKYGGMLNIGIAYPLYRALFGKRLRQPLGGEVALSGPFAQELLLDRDWKSDPRHAGGDVWLAAKALTGKQRVCQAYLGTRAVTGGGEAVDSVATILTRVADLLFREAERHVMTWQRVRGSAQQVVTFGESLPCLMETAEPEVTPILDHFRFGLQNLQGFWKSILPPRTLLALQRAATVDAATFRLDDALWARILYDFLLAYHMKTIERGQVLKSMTPLYFGWLASFVSEVRGLGGAEVEERVEKLCLAFEAEKPYLISRWRWPDNFAP